MTDDSDALDPSRQLCPDGACIGVIGPDGRCKECGAVSDAPPSNPSPRRDEADSDPLDADHRADEDGDAPADDGEGAQDVSDRDADDDEFDPYHRELCADDSCIGVIGPDDRCKECGLPGPSAALDPRERGLRRSPDEDENADDGEDDEFATRRLCSDGSCIGLIGEDGRCKECGASADAAAGVG